MYISATTRKEAENISHGAFFQNLYKISLGSERQRSEASVEDGEDFGAQKKNRVR